MHPLYKALSAIIVFDKRTAHNLEKENISLLITNITLATHCEAVTQIILRNGVKDKTLVN